MCGVVAALGLDLGAEARRRALQAIARRGPDGEGTWRGDGVWLGHRRLAIMAPDDGAQPLASEDGRVHAVVNGEFYGFEAVRRDLEARGHRFATRTDSEILVHTYEDRGVDAIADLRGEFAFVLHDREANRLVAARDRFGVKPLVYAEHRGGLVLASKPSALFALGVPAAWDAQAFLHAMTHQYLPPDRTLFAGVRRVPPGHVLTCAPGGAPALRPYATPFPTTPALEGPDAEAALEAALVAAVQDRLQADAPVALALSGGLDSALVAAIAARSRPITTFGVDFDRPPYAEAAAARDVAAHIGADHHVVPVRAADLLDTLPEAVALTEGLAINGQLPAKLALARAIRAAGFEVVLTGEGADELFFGYPHLSLDHAAEIGGAEGEAIRQRIAAHHGASRGVMLPTDAAPLEPVERRLGYVPAFVRAKAGFGARLVGLLDAEGQRRAQDSLPRLLDGLTVRPGPRASRSADLWSQLCLAGYILETLGDGTEMAASIEGRPPFLDDRVAAVAARIPPADKIRPDLAKHALRRVARRWLPARIADRPKHPFLAPPVVSTPTARGIARDLLAPARLPFVDPSKLGAWLDGLPDTPEPQKEDPVLFTLLTAALLARRFGLEDAR